MYINGAGAISPQRTYDNGVFLDEIHRYDGNLLPCALPDFKDYIHPLKLRRLSRMLKMGLASAVVCLREARLESPDAIITATGYGLQGDVVKFLREVLEQREEQLTPTYFMQSTYNALSGLLALSFRCTGYNNTYVNKGFAFESALGDALLLLSEGEAKNVLVGGFDEFSPVQYSDYVRLGYLKPDSGNNLELFDTRTAGTLQGEGVAFFLLSSTLEPQTLCRLKAVRSVYRPADYGELSWALECFLGENLLEPSAIDVYVNGASGDVSRDAWNQAIRRDYLPQAREVRFKHLCGEYATASSFGLWLGARILKNQRIPPSVLAEPSSRPGQIKTVLICNHFLARHYSFLLLEGLETELPGIPAQRPSP